MVYRMIFNQTAYFGRGAIKEIPAVAKSHGFTKAFIVTDPILLKTGTVKKVTDVLDEAGLPYEVFDNVKPNPPVECIQDGVAKFAASGADFLIGLGGAAHQSWSANIFSTVGDMFPRTAIASITGIGGMAGGIGSMILQKVAGNLFVYASGTTMVDGKEVEMTKELLEQGAQFVHPAMTFMGFEGKPAGYFVIFCVCAVAYLIGWVIMKALVPKYKPIVLD